MLVDMIVFPIKKLFSLVIGLFSFLNVVKYTNPYKISKSSQQLSQDSPQTEAYSFSLTMLGNVIDHHSKQNPIHNNVKTEDKFRQELMLYDNVIENNVEKEGSVLKRSIVDGNITLSDLQQAIYDGKDAIFNEYKIEDMFDLLTNEIQDYKEEFVWKGRLFQLIYNNLKIRKLYEMIMIEEYEDFQADNVLHFYNKKLSFCEIPKNNYLEQENANNQQEYERDKKTTLLLNRIINQNRNYLDENRDYINKFNKMFKLFWEHNFYMFEGLRSHFEEIEDSTGISEINKIETNECVYYDIKYEMVSDEVFIIDDIYNENNVNLRIVSSSKRNRKFLQKATNSLSDTIKFYLENCKNSLDFEKMW
ncbi:hypothetical protein EDEG_02375 [Edhazardia aedis USNM 41457]|uniref:Uncharacterized protein n=1 Tax=Edhazardia aedis (strain USNM 41457) TaxID=1003232 RepID=J9D652_EDHAE|nr:hypothetical protein EDEG_02375 [Edhazardia aedis USNM 41457]|eukprot:EJW03271.1 hypothetical protein EDEG_02375 [Edhazardia aedis USNM 41457]